jgi:Ca-activated chloride channel family protein
MRTVICSLLFVAALALCGLTLPLTSAQREQTQKQVTPQPTPDTQDNNVERITIRRVRLPITVIDKKGQPVAGLTASDFQILEDKKPQQIETFADEKESLPIYVGVLMDTSSSTAGKLKFEQESAKNFMYSVVRLRKDRIAFVTFGDDVQLQQDFTDKLDLLDKAVDKVKQSGGHTALYDAVWQTCDEKMRSVAGRRVLVVITDGQDTYSRATLRDAIDLAQRTETIIFGISTKAGFSGTVPGVEAGQVASGADRDLVKLCEETGGAAFFTGDMLALERSFTRISRELHMQYIVTYKPTNDRYDGSFRRIEVRLASQRDGMKVRTKHGCTAIADNIGR